MSAEDCDICGKRPHAGWCPEEPERRAFDERIVRMERDAVALRKKIEEDKANG